MSLLQQLHEESKQLTDGDKLVMVSNDAKRLIEPLLSADTPLAKELLEDLIRYIKGNMQTPK